MSERIRVLVVEDEPLARAGMCDLLRADTDIEVIGEAANARDAAEFIRMSKPDLVMLDVQLADSNGFDVIAEIKPENMPAVVFVTAYNEYAVAAFEVNAVDYLLKPFDDDRFAVTLARAKKVIRQSHMGDLSARLTELLNGHMAPAPTPDVTERYLDRVVVKSAGRSILLKAAEVDWIEAADYYVKIHSGKQSHLLRESMNTLETRLDPERFFRVHRSAIVNLDRIREIQPYFRGEHVVILEDGTKLKLSRARRDKLETALRQRL
ncbi:MAG TPA: LytTR family DNA-binding domain-containing protein [Longimicrobiales bacterium]|nr:LytTR family DNA-binding domain-containing protein [Longimicrobiales bacterium]